MVWPMPSSTAQCSLPTQKPPSMRPSPRQSADSGRPQRSEHPGLTALRRAARKPLGPSPERAPLKSASPPDDAPSQARQTVPAFSKRTPMSCLETYATLRVFSREIAPEEIGRLLAIDGSKLRLINPGSRYRHEREHHYWAWSTQSRVLALDGLQHVGAIIEVLRGKEVSMATRSISLVLPDFSCRTPIKKIGHQMVWATTPACDQE